MSASITAGQTVSVVGGGTGCAATAREAAGCGRQVTPTGRSTAGRVGGRSAAPEGKVGAERGN